MMSSIVLHMQRHSVSSSAARIMLAIIALKRMRLKSESVVVIIIILTMFIISYLAKGPWNETNYTNCYRLCAKSHVNPEIIQSKLAILTTHCCSDCFGCRDDFACCASALSSLFCLFVVRSLAARRSLVERHIFIGVPNATHTKKCTQDRPKIENNNNNW